MLDVAMTLSSMLSQCAPEVAPSTMAAIVSVESRGNPYAIGVNRGRQVRQPTSAAEAVAVAKRLLARGANIDLGLGQINSSNLKWLGLSVEAAFDSCSNLAAAARVLTGNYRRAVALGIQSPLGAALSAYNTGSMQRGYGNGYVAKVYRASGTRLLTSPVPANVPPAPVQLSAVAEEGLESAAPVSVLAAAISSVGEAVAPPPPPPPPAWDVFAQAASANVFSNTGKGADK